jgi:PAS domain S-box-containing protein
MRQALTPLLGSEGPMLLFILPVLISAVFGGLGPGLLATVLSTLLGSYFFIPPVGSLIPNTFASCLLLGIFLLEGGIISGLSAALQRAQEQVARRAQELAASEERLSRSVETIVDGIVIADTGGRLIFANRAAEHLLRLNRSSIAARRYDDPHWQATTLDGKPLSSDQLPVAQVLRTEAPVFGVEHAITYPDATRSLLSVNAGPLRDGDDAVVGVVASFRDVTAQKQAEEQIRIWADIFHVSPLGIVVSPADTATMLHLNPAFAAMHGAAVADLQGRPLTELIAPEFRAEVPAYTEELFARGLLSFESAHLRADGTRFPVQFTVSVVRDAAGAPLYRVATVQDITERKAAEAERERLLAQAEWARTLLDTLISAAPIGFAFQDTALRYQLINERLAAINGLPISAHQGCVAEEIVPWLAPTVTPLLQEVLKTERPLVDLEIADAPPAALGDPRHWLVSYYPVRVPDGGLLGVGTVVQDITARKQAELAAERAAARLRALHTIDRAILAAQAPAATAETALVHMRQVVPFTRALTLMLDSDGTASLLARVGEGSSWPGDLGRLSAEAVAAFDTQLSVPDLAAYPARTALMERALADGLRSLLAVPLHARGQPLGAVIVTGGPPSAFNDEHVAIVGEVADQLAVALQQAQLREALQRYAAELEDRVAERTAQLEAANADLEAFAYIAAHDLRAPLRGLQGFAAAVLEDYTDVLDPLGQQYLQRIAATARQMDTLISDLLWYSRLSRSALQIQPVSLRQIVGEALAQLQPQIAERDAEIVVAEGLPAVAAHHTTLVQTVVNLLNNAIMFVAPGVHPRIRVWAERRAEDDRMYVRLWLEDNGIGIAPHHQQRIFQVFERLHSQDAYPGTGIGLAIVRRGLERMGGRVGVESAEGQGSRFWIELPAAEDS